MQPPNEFKKHLFLTDFCTFFCKVMLVKEFSFLSSFCFSVSLVRKTSHYTVATVNKPSFKERSWFFNGCLKMMGRHFANYLNQQLSVSLESFKHLQYITSSHRQTRRRNCFLLKDIKIQGGLNNFCYFYILTLIFKT